MNGALLVLVVLGAYDFTIENGALVVHDGGRTAVLDAPLYAARVTSARTIPEADTVRVELESACGTLPGIILKRSAIEARFDSAAAKTSPADAMKLLTRAVRSAPADALARVELARLMVAANDKAGASVLLAEGISGGSLVMHQQLASTPELAALVSLREPETPLAKVGENCLLWAPERQLAAYCDDEDRVTVVDAVSRKLLIWDLKTSAAAANRYLVWSGFIVPQATFQMATNDGMTSTIAWDDFEASLTMAGLTLKRPTHVMLRKPLARSGTLVFDWGVRLANKTVAFLAWHAGIETPMCQDASGLEVVLLH